MSSPSKEGERRNNTSIRGPADVGPVHRQTDLLTRDDQCSYHCTSSLGFAGVTMGEFQQCSRPRFGNACQSGVDSPCTHQSTKANQQQEDGELLVILNIARWTDTTRCTVPLGRGFALTNVSPLSGLKNTCTKQKNCESSEITQVCFAHESETLAVSHSSCE